jgi:hypothetical protein
MKSIERTTRSLLMNIMKRYAFDCIPFILSQHLLFVGIHRTPLTGGYNSSSNACTVCVSRWLTMSTANDQLPLSQLMALIRRRGSE